MGVGLYKILQFSELRRFQKLWIRGCGLYQLQTSFLILKELESTVLLLAV